MALGETPAMREIIEMDPTWSITVGQSFYMLPERRGLYPGRTFVKKTERGPEVFFETNLWGLKGPEPDGAKPVMVMWGDSVVFAFGRSWVEMLNDHQQEYCVLNGGIEGDDPVNILRRMWDMNRRHKIDVNIFFPGWHARPGYTYTPPTTWLPKPSLGDVLPKVIEEGKFTNLILCTLPTWLSLNLIEEDVAAHIHLGGNIDVGYFVFWSGCSDTFSKDLALRIYYYIQERNDIIKAAAKKYGLGLIDLFEHFRFESMIEAKKTFFDVCHFRPTAYPRLSQILLEELKKLKVLA